jgi:hypothetical protein
VRTACPYSGSPGGTTVTPVTYPPIPQISIVLVDHPIFQAGHAGSIPVAAPRIIAGRRLASLDASFPTIAVLRLGRISSRRPLLTRRGAGP